VLAGLGAGFQRGKLDLPRRGRMCTGEEQEREGKEGPRHRAEATLPVPPEHFS